MRNGPMRVLATVSLLGLSIFPLNFAWAEPQPPSIPATTTIPADTAPSPSETQAQASDEYLEELRIGLERLARSYPSQEAHMAQLRLGLERLARSINSLDN
jgi:hypothetical protein